MLLIPHIVDGIASFISPKDVLQSQSVSRVWREAFTPVVWRVYGLCIKDKDSLQSDMVKSLIRIAPHVRDIHLRPESARLDCLADIGVHLPRTSRLTLDGSRNDSIPWERVFALAHTLFPHLSELRIRCDPDLKEFVSVIASTTSTTVINRLRKLSYEASPNRTYDDSTQIVPLVCGLASLESLYIKALWWRRFNHGVMLTDPPADPFRFLKLEIVGAGNTMSADQILPLWRQSPLLEHFHIPWSNPADLEAVVELFDDRRDGRLRPVKVLKLDNYASLSDRQLARILRGCAPQCLTTLELASSRLGPEAVRVLLATQAESLERITTGGRVEAGVDSSPLIQQILASCPRLVMLHCFHGWRGHTVSRVAASMYLRADDIVSSVWVCQRLKDLAVPILGGSLHDEVCRGCEQGGEGGQESVVERAMRQLGQMTRLERLSIAKPFDKHGVDRDRSPPLTLGPGGLQHWSELKRLEQLDIKNCTHQLGVAEVEWMAMHLPQLLCIFGLESNLETVFRRRKCGM